jgi:hypothetical protein
VSTSTRQWSIGGSWRTHGNDSQGTPSLFPSSPSTSPWLSIQSCACCWVSKSEQLYVPSAPLGRRGGNPPVDPVLSAGGGEVTVFATVVCHER